MHKSKPDLSIVIVSFNTLQLTRQCLQSIAGGADGISFEIWVVDNDSSDGSIEMIVHEFPDVQLICNANNRGLAAATNQGLEKSSGRYVVTLNSDTVVMPGSFERLVRFMDANPDAGGATPKLVVPDGGTHPGFIGNVPNLTSELLDILSVTNKKFAELLYAKRFDGWTDYERTCEVPCILWGTCFIVRREALEMVGLQDPRFFIYCEDWDWSVSITRRGWKLYFVADAEVLHYGGMSTKQAGIKMYAQMWKSKFRYLQKQFGSSATLIARSIMMLVCSMRICKWSIFMMIRPGLREKAADRIRFSYMLIRVAVRC